MVRKKSFQTMTVLLFPKSFATYIQLFSDKNASSLKVPAQVAYPAHAWLFSFSNEYKQWLEQSGHSLVAFLPIEYVDKQQCANNDLAEMEEFLYRYFSFALVEVEAWIPVTYFYDGRELKKSVLHKAVSIVLPDIDRISFLGFFAELGENFFLNVFGL